MTHRFHTELQPPIGSVITCQVSESIHSFRIRFDLNWREIYKGITPYVLTKSRTRNNYSFLIFLEGRIPKCRGCNQELIRDQPHIQVQTLFRPPNTGPYPACI